MKDFDYDLFVIGAGSGGIRAARIAAALGARVAVAEERYLGGTCVNVGCVPKKLFSYAAHFMDSFKDSAGFGWTVSGTRFDWATLKRNKDLEISRLNDIYQKMLDQGGVTVYRQRARLKGANTIALEDKDLTARYILLAVGGWPSIPDYPGNGLAVSSNEVFAMESLPDCLTVVGGGYIAVEFASIFSGLGRETTLIYRGNKLLRGFDEDVRDLITAHLDSRVRLLLEEEIQQIATQADSLTITLGSGTEVNTGLVLSATGRKPLTDDLGLQTVSVELDENGAVIVDDQYESSVDGIYAIGDVINRVALTPVALAEGELVARQLFGPETLGSFSYENIPTAVFCHPNVASCGLTETEARARGIELDIYMSKFKPLKHTLSGREQQSLIKLLVDRFSDRVIGAHIVAEEAGELMQGIAVAINAGATKRQFDSTIGIHPTLAEEFVTLRTPVAC